jgi:hypothetical protein
MKPHPFPLIATAALMVAPFGCMIVDRDDEQGDEVETGDTTETTTAGETTEGTTTEGETTEGTTTAEGDTTEGTTTGDGEGETATTEGGETTTADETTTAATEDGAACDPADVEACQTAGLSAQTACMGECNGNDCAARVCELGCLETGATEAAECFGTLVDCGADVMRAQCMAACGKAYAACFEDAKCDEQAGCEQAHTDCAATCQ